MSAVALPADKRFRRAHVKPARRRRWRSRVRPLIKYSLIAVLTLYGGYRGANGIAHGRALQIDRIVVKGNTKLSRERVVALLADLRGQNILSSNLDAWRNRLLTSPWIKDAAFRRVLPATVEVLIQERQPIGLGRIHGQLYLVDEHGVVIDHYGPSYAEFDLPIVDGLSDSSKGSEVSADGPRAALAARLIAALHANPEVGSRLSQIDVSDVRNAGVILSGDPTVLYVGNDRFLPRLQSYLQLAETMKERVPGIDSLDLRFDDLIYARIAGRSERAEALAKPARPLGHDDSAPGAKQKQ